MTTPIDALTAAFAARWPYVPFDAARLDAARIGGLGGDHEVDVVLAWAAAAGIAPAIEELESRVLAPALTAVRARNLAPPTSLEDIAQLTRMRLLTGDPPGITSYQGRGSLAAFVRTTAMRIAIDQQRANTDDISDALVDHVVTDPALAHMRERYAADLTAALHTAWTALAAHDRFVLELELHQHLSIEHIARVYGIHRTNATRRIASARTSLVAATRAALRDKLGVADATLDSILRLLTTSRRWAALAAIGDS